MSQIFFMTIIPWSLVSTYAEKSGIDYRVIGALIMKESGGTPCAIKTEPNWKYVFNENEFAKLINSSVDTEIQGQKMSWGLCQVMGTVAREHGFRGWFPELCNPEDGIKYGVMHFAQKLKENGGDIPSAFAAYNAGKAIRKSDGTFVNQAYVDEAMKYLAQIKEVMHDDP